MSESMTPQENFDFINEYLAVMGPCIKNNNGSVNLFLGDGLMALFPGSAEDAVTASVQMSTALSRVWCRGRPFQTRSKCERERQCGRNLSETLCEQSNDGAG